jgi:predicted TIM-barrel fold metal-dependent hydrolase
MSRLAGQPGGRVRSRAGIGQLPPCAVDQALTSIPPLSGRGLVDLVRRNNEELAELVSRHPDRFAGFAAGTALADPDAATEEAVRSVRELGALGVQLEADAANLPLHDDRYESLFATLDEFGAGVWLHPYRTPGTPGSPTKRRRFFCGRSSAGRSTRRPRSFS